MKAPRARHLPLSALTFVLLAFFSVNSFAGLPISVRLLEGPSKVTQISEKPGERGLILSSGIGVAYQLAPRHTISVDVESMERRERSVHLRYTPITVSYRYTVNAKFNHYAVYLIGGLGFGPISQYDSYAQYSGSFIPSDDGSVTFGGDPQWQSGMLLGLGGSMRIEPTVLLMGVLQYRHLDYRTHAVVLPGGSPPPVYSLPVIKGGLEAKLIVEFRL